MATVLPRPVHADRAAPLATDLVAAVVVAGLCVVGLWVRHGGLTALAGPWATSWTAATDLTGLLASYAGLVGLVLVARPVALERAAGLDRLFIWHRYAGATTAILVGAHVVAGVVAASSAPGGVWGAIRDLTGREPYMAGATVGALLVGVVTVTSLRSFRQQLAYETFRSVDRRAADGRGASPWLTHSTPAVSSPPSTSTTARWPRRARPSAASTCGTAGPGGRPAHWRRSRCSAPT